ncbi:ABC transporter ATP-binding protein [Streptomyces sp. TG1A-8]|uniref:energy-coupling factor ABC transporter ATP-binding protein n=1 Tax=Streptomyces sp. TG1A-8 TaxID=3051385 RepID=UPI00265BD8FE|nr:ABC transporter ATP-binding protein [Streptomyces sp. TG1A-8]MDO0924231.1 ABC transporter ATP-binding protein [Streptomyces sp. TG1A-8]
MIEFNNYSFAYPTGSTDALSGVQLRVEQGELVVVVGAEGAGKSTLAASIGGTVPHLTGGETTGTVRVAGRPVADTPVAELAAHVGLVMQNPFNQISGARFSVRAELAFGLENLGVERGEMGERVDQVMADLGITGLAHRSPYELSGGQQQLLAIGSVLAMRPSVLVLDEPTSQLDADGARLVLDTLGTLRESGTTVVLVEHRLELPAHWGPRVVVLENGRIVADGTAQDVLTDPRLADWGVAPLDYTTAARRAAGHGLWPRSRPLPITLDAAAEGFTRAGRRPLVIGDGS